MQKLSITDIFYSRLFVLLFVICFLPAKLYSNPIFVTRHFVHSSNAVYDLRHHDFLRKVYALDGKWEFYWHKLLAPDEIEKYRSQAILVDVPNNWSKYVINGKHLPNTGYATYHLKIIIPPEEKYFSFSVHGIFTSYRLYINGKFIDENGKVSTNPKTQKGTWLPKTYVFYSNSDTIDIVLQVSNFIHFKSGILRPVIVGRPRSMYRYSILGISYEGSLLGAMLMMALYFLFLFYYEPHNVSSLYLALVLIGQTILTGLDGEYIIFRIFPHLNFKFAIHLLYFFFLYRTLLFLHYLYFLVPKEFNVKIVLGVTGIFFVMFLYVIFLPIKYFYFALLFYIVATFTLGVYAIYQLIKLIKYQIGAVYTLLGLSILLLTGVNDMLYDFGYIHTFYMIGLGFVVFIFMLSMMIAMRNARCQNQVLAYSLMLKKLSTLREELVKIPFYDLAGALNIVVSLLGTSRGVWIDKEGNDLMVSYETFLSESKEIKKNLDDLPKNYLSRLAVTISLKFRRMFVYSLNKRDLNRRLRNKKNLVRIKLANYLTEKRLQALAVTPISQKSQILSLLYLENRYKAFSNFQKRLVLSIIAQLAALKTNADSYKKLQDLNNKLEYLVRERTEILKQQERELYSKEAELKEKMEELQAYNEQINRIHSELEKSKTEIEQKNFELEKLHNEIFKQKELAEKRYASLIEKIKFAQQIQDLILRIEPNLPFKDLFILYLPKNIVSGDFYWIRRFGHKIILTVADCTGHGVPGAFMSILGATLLNEIFNRYYLLDPELKDLRPSMVLDELREKVIKTLGQEQDSTDNIKDGMDIALAIYDEQTKTLEFSGAYLPAYIVRGKELIELKGDRQPIGVYYRASLRKPFTTKQMQMQNGDVLYLFTDGYSDQFNPKGEKFYKKNLRRVLLEISEYSGSIQKDLLLKIHLEWRGDHYQVDDILILGVIF